MSNKLIANFSFQEIFDVAKEFLKIEKVEFGGPKGKVLGANISAVYWWVNLTFMIFWYFFEKEGRHLHLLLKMIQCLFIILLGRQISSHIWN